MDRNGIHVRVRNARTMLETFWTLLQSKHIAILNTELKNMVTHQLPLDIEGINEALEAINETPLGYTLQITYTNGFPGIEQYLPEQHEEVKRRYWELKEDLLVKQATVYQTHIWMAFAKQP